MHSPKKPKGKSITLVTQIATSTIPIQLHKLLKSQKQYEQD